MIDEESLLPQRLGDAALSSEELHTRVATPHRIDLVGALGDQPGADRARLFKLVAPASPAQALAGC